MHEMLQKDEIVIREIIDASKTLFKKYGFRKTTMEDIARSMGRAKSSLYYYYSSKEEIFEAVINAEMEELLEQIYKSINQVHTAKEKLIAYCRCRLNKLSQLYNLSDALKSELGELQCVMAGVKSKLDTSHLELVKEILVEGVKNGEFKKISHDNIELVAYLMISTFKGLAIPLTISNKSCPRLDLQIDSIVDIMVDGIGK
jgi:AcrR family transcriptional regulator